MANHGTTGDDAVESATKQPVSRRRFLSHTGLAGASALGLAAVDARATTVDDTVEIVVVEHLGEALVTKEVPQGWYQAVQRSRTVRDVLVDRYQNEAWLGSIGRSAGSASIGGMAVPTITAYARDVATAERKLPSQIDGVTIDIAEHEDPVLNHETPGEQSHCSHLDWCNNNNYSCVPGGAYVVPQLNDGSKSCHSGTCIVTHNGAHRYMTCAHGFLDSCSDDISGNRLEQGSSKQYVGTVTAYSAAQDWAVVSEAWNSQIGGFNNTIIGRSQRVRGHVTQDGVDTLVSNSQTIYKYGARTCRTSGVVDEERQYTYCNWSEPFVLSTNNVEGGDSGSPHYIFYEDGGTWYLAIVGLLHGSTSTHAWCPAAYKISGDHGIGFGASTTTC